MTNYGKNVGFTLIELLVVISIIALLMSILMPSLGMAKETARRVICSTNLNSIGLGYSVYSSENDDYLPISFYMMPSLEKPNELFYKEMYIPYRAFRIFEILPGDADKQFPDNIAEWGSSATYEGNRKGWELNGTKRMWGTGTLFYFDILDGGKSLYCPSIPKSDDIFAYAAYNETGPWPSRRPAGASSEAGMGQKNIFSGYYYMPQSRSKKITVPDNNMAVDLEVPIAALKVDDLDNKAVMSVDMMKTGFLGHKSGSRNGVSALFGDGHVDFNNDSKVFQHRVWHEGIDINNSPGVLRAIIMGIEGRTQYMDDIILTNE